MMKLYQTPSPIFFDPKGYRWKVFLVILLLSTIFIGFVFFYIYKTKVSLYGIENDFKSLNYDSYVYERNLPKKGLIAFLDNEYASYYSLKENITRVAAVVVPWVNFENNGKLKLDSSDLKDLETDFVGKFKPSINLFLQISDYNFVDQAPNKDSFINFLNSYTDEDIKLISKYILNNGFKGLVYNFNSDKWDDNTIDKFLTFRQRFDEITKKENLVIVDAINLKSSDYLLNKLNGKQNLFVVNYWNNTFNENTGFFDFDLQPQQLKNLIQKMGNTKYYINFPTYSKDIVFGSEGEVSYEQKISFGSVVDIIKKYNLQIQTDEKTKNSFVDYKDDKNVSHRIWLGDGALLFNQLFDLSKLLPEEQYEGYAFSNAGFEDHSIWDVLKAETFNSKLSILENNFQIDTLVENKGQGVLAKLESDFKFGQRVFKYSTGYISGQKWDKLPERSVVQRMGYKPKTVTLTFDDGPDPVYTPKILDILKKYNIKATFFVIGKNIKEYPEIARRIVDEGHIIANHTYSHPKLNNLSSVTIDTEISGTDEILSKLVNVKTDYFRTPYNDIYGFNTENDLSILRELRKYNKLAVEDDVDTKDWLLKDAKAIASKTFDILDSQSGSVLLLHDGGGNRDSTVQSLPTLIEGIQARGYAIENFNSVLDANTSNSSAQNVEFNEQEFSLKVSRTVSQLLATLIVFATIIGVFKYALMLLLYIFAQFRNKKIFGLSQFSPSVSVIVPCYNEEKVICNTVNSLLLSEYPNLEIVVVDDGSKDNSYQTVLNAFKDNPRVSVYTKENGGKSSALNFGVAVAKHEYVICVDADTVFMSDAIAKLMRHFKNENIGGVAGNVQIGNTVNNLTKAQQLEYALGQNFEKIAFSAVNSVVVVPGPIGAWRKPVLLGAGGYHKDNLAEDTDLTLRVLQQGWRIHYEPEAVCITECPEDYKSFIKQRNRWQFGMLQVIYKNMEVLFNASYGFIGMFTLPIMLFQYLLMSIYPLMMMSVGLYFGNLVFETYNGGIGLGYNFLLQNKLFLYFTTLYVTLDIFKIIISIVREKYVKNKLNMVLIIPYYLFIFQNLMSFITFWTLVRAVKGKIATWGHLTRTGGVALSQVQKPNN